MAKDKGAYGSYMKYIINRGQRTLKVLIGRSISVKRACAL